MPVTEGGLGVPILELKARLWHRNRIHGLLDLREGEPVVWALLQLPTFERALERATTPIMFEGVEIPSKEAIDKYFARRLHQSVDDRGLKESRLVPAAASWIGNGATSLPGRMYISIMLRSCKYRHFYFIFLLF